MAISSIHINPVKANSEIHNKRLKEYDYVRKDLTPNNESWEKESISDARKRINKAYKESTGQKIQKKATPIREGVVNLNPDNTMEDLLDLKEKLYNEFGIKTIQIHIHRDEGHAKSKTWKQNLHAHMVFDWTDEQGKTLKLNMHDMSKFQDIVADTLRMERGQKSSKKHLSSIAYKVQEIEKDIEKLQKKITNKEKHLDDLNFDVQKINLLLQQVKVESENLCAKNAILEEELRNRKKINEELENEKAGIELGIKGVILKMERLDKEYSKKKEELQKEWNYLTGKGEMEDLVERFIQIVNNNPEYISMDYSSALEEFAKLAYKEAREQRKL